MTDKRIEIWEGGRLAGSSGNLRGIMDYARKHQVSMWLAIQTDDYGARITMTFANGAASEFNFASWDVAQRWIRARRSWRLHSARCTATQELWTWDI